MNPLFFLFVAEETLLHLAKDQRSTIVSVNQVHQGLKHSVPALFSELRYSRVKDAMKQIFPIYKNNRCHTKFFKIRADEAYQYLGEHRIRLKPRKQIIALAKTKGMIHGGYEL